MCSYLSPNVKPNSTPKTFFEGLTHVHSKAVTISVIVFFCCLFAMVSLFSTPHCHHRVAPGSDPSGPRSYCRPWPQSPPRRSRRRSAPLRRTLGKRRCEDSRRSASGLHLGNSGRFGEVRNFFNHHGERQTFSFSI